MDHLRVYPNAAQAGGGDVEMGHAGVYPPLPAQQDQPAIQPQRLGGPGPNSWVGNDANTLLVVATLITTLTYQLGTSIPGGYWQQDVPRSPPDGTVMYRAGDPIMRDLHRPRYFVFMGASWVGFASSMVMTLSLLVRMPVDSRARAVVVRGGLLQPGANLRGVAAEDAPVAGHHHLGGRPRLPLDHHQPPPRPPRARHPRALLPRPRQLSSRISRPHHQLLVASLTSCRISLFLFFLCVPHLHPHGSAND